jgi:hypothetical protein
MIKDNAASCCAGSLQQAESSIPVWFFGRAVGKAVNNIMILFAREVQSEQNRAM